MFHLARFIRLVLTAADIPLSPLICAPHSPAYNVPVHKETKALRSSHFFSTSISLSPITAVSARVDDFATIQSHHTPLKLSDPAAPVLLQTQYYLKKCLLCCLSAVSFHGTVSLKNIQSAAPLTTTTTLALRWCSLFCWIISFSPKIYLCLPSAQMEFM